MYMAFHATDSNRLAIEIDEDSAEVLVQFLTQWFVARRKGRRSLVEKTV
jgi:hypothetical protein